MDDRRKKILTISLSTAGMLVFVYFAFVAGSDGERNEDLVNPAEMDDSPSRRELLEEKRKRDRKEFDFDRKVTSLDHFLEDQVEKDPFEDPGAGKELKEYKEEEEPVEQEPEVREKIVYVPRAVETSPEAGQSREPDIEVAEQEENEKRRRVGFASGGNQEREEGNEGENEGIQALAVVHEDVRVQSGSNVKLRIIESFEAGDVMVAENTFVYGEVKFGGDRIFIDVESFSVNGQLMDTPLTAYDLNGVRGLHVEGGLDKEIKTDLLEETVQEVQKNVDVPILRDVPFSTAKKKIKEREVPIMAGYKVYLRSQ